MSSAIAVQITAICAIYETYEQISYNFAKSRHLAATSTNLQGLEASEQGNTSCAQNPDRRKDARWIKVLS
ncbi:hypothetical protein GCM10011499_34310 [Pelagibacterium lentulum]|uniref:Uncharacterized protein n=1 Tax=Pelagibacterium lentulum TaxID=2029865 RepID=A0A916RPA8_9HYPH|nr:hypothetical protein GCM10011499_34310 [Pelagibacterium lentulum]